MSNPDYEIAPNNKLSATESPWAGPVATKSTA